MHPDLVHLFAASEMDRELLALKARKKKLEDALTTAESTAASTARSVETASAAIAANENRQRELTREIEKYEARRTSAERVLSGGGGDPEAAERQVVGTTAQLDKLETELLERMEELEQLSEDLEGHTQAAAAAATILEAQTRSNPLEIGAMRTAFEGIVVRRDAELAELDNETRAKYLALRDRKGSAVALVEKGACRACRIVVRQQHFADLKRGLMHACSGCSRWLVVPEAIG